MRIVEVIEEYTAEYGYAPSVREIAHRVDLASTSAVQYHLDRLVAQGLVRRGTETARSLRVVRRKSSTVCGRPGCGKSLVGRQAGAKWCSRSCTAIAGHVRGWLRASGNARLLDELGLS
jgi:SOS-response transcriptional repressor LexA